MPPKVRFGTLPIIDTNCKLVLKGESEPDRLCCTANCDAGFKKGAAGFCVELALANGRNRTFKKRRTTVNGPIQAEILTLVYALKEAERLGCRSIVLRTDCISAIRLIAGALDLEVWDAWTPRKPHIVEAVDAAISCLDDFEYAVLEHVRTKRIRRVDREAGRQRRRAEKEKKAKEKDVEDRLKLICERAGSVKLEKSNNAYLANGKYIVRLDPPSCSCPQWTTKWKKVPREGKRARRLPCKHLVALCLSKDVSLESLLKRVRWG